jgi:hypothetical protein
MFEFTGATGLKIEQSQRTRFTNFYTHPVSQSGPRGDHQAAMGPHGAEAVSGDAM